MASKLTENFATIALSKFKGFSCQMIVSFPYSFTFFLVYETTKKQLSNIYGKFVIASIIA